MKANEIMVWVLYDIANDRARAKIARCCRQAGLYRVQFSVFTGSVNRNSLDELCLQMEQLMADDDKIYVFPMCEEDFKKCRLMGKAFDKKLVRDELLEMIV